MDYIIYFVITIGILVFVHELGHFLAAKLCKMRASVFALGFGRRIIGWNKITGFTMGPLSEDLELGDHTDYRLSMLPLGGYVKISGMIDESFDTSFAGKAPEPYEFRAKPAYQKLFVISAGVLMNFLLTLVIFSMLNFTTGKKIIKSTTIGQIEKGSLAMQFGFQSYDKILEINKKEVDSYSEVINGLLVDKVGKDKQIKVLRDGEEKDFIISADVFKEADLNSLYLPVGDIATIVGKVVPGSPAEEAGIIERDAFFTLNGKKIKGAQDVVTTFSESKDKAVAATFLRGKDTVALSVVPSIEGRIGIQLGYEYIGDFEIVNFGVFSSIGEGFKDIVYSVETTFAFIKSVFVGETKMSSAFGGPVKIAKIAAESADMGIVPFLKFLAAISLSLAIINILPFPVLDGGHFVIILIEAILRREIPLKIKIAIQNAGVIILLALMAFIIYSDIVSL